MPGSTSYQVPHSSTIRPTRFSGSYLSMIASAWRGSTRPCRRVFFSGLEPSSSSNWVAEPLVRPVPRVIMQGQPVHHRRSLAHQHLGPVVVAVVGAAGDLEHAGCRRSCAGSVWYSAGIRPRSIRGACFRRSPSSRCRRPRILHPPWLRRVRLRAGDRPSGSCRRNVRYSTHCCISCTVPLPDIAADVRLAAESVRTGP